MRFYLIQGSQQFAEDFKKQNLVTLSSGDTFELARTLNSLSNSLHWQCIKGIKDGQIFYERSKSNDCSEGYFQTRFEIGDEYSNGISIRFTFSLPPSLKWAGLAFVFVQLALMWSISVEARRSTKRTEQEKLKGQIELAFLAAQVAHDIRSPLAALKVVASSSSKLPEEMRHLVTSTISRISDIANTLLDKNRAAISNHKLTPSIHLEPALDSCLIASIVEPLVAEKRSQYSVRPTIDIKMRLDGGAYAAYAKVNKIEFTRILSNLIDNSIEAIRGPGIVELAIQKTEQHIEVSVQDNGWGIPAETLGTLGERGRSIGKPGGSGLGLYHTKKALERWGGVLQISSQLGSGTRVTAKIKRSDPPAGFTTKLVLKPNAHIIVLDDDRAIHSLWEQNLKDITKYGVSIEYHTHGIDAAKAIHKILTKGIECLAFIDDELFGQNISGLDVIDTSGALENSILITNNHEDPEIVRRCESTGLRLIPKCFVGIVPISVA